MSDIFTANVLNDIHAWDGRKYFLFAAPCIFIGKKLQSTLCLTINFYFFIFPINIFSY